MFLLKIRYSESGPVVTSEGDIKEMPLETGSGFLDGWLSNEIASVESLERSDLAGVYNFVFVDRRTGDVEVRNDLLGQRPLYFSVCQGLVVLGTIFWRVAVAAGKTSNDICTGAMAQLRSYRRLAPSSRTPLQGVHLLPAGCKLSVFKHGFKFDLRPVKSMEQRPDRKIGADVAADQLNVAIERTFDTIGDKFKSEELWFGNSGGLDSRLIPAYADRAGLSLNGFIVSEAKPHWLASQSQLSSDVVAKMFGFENKKINYDAGNSWDRLLRDIFVNPFGPANFHKNARYEEFSGRVILTGGNSFLIANDSNLWRSLSTRDDVLDQYVSRILCRDTAEKSDRNYLDLVSGEIHAALGESDGFSLLRAVHQIYLNKTSPAGAFESMNLAGDFQYIYYPFISEASKEWPEEVFYDRAVQMALFRKYFPGLLEIPDQKGEVWSKHGQLGVAAKVRKKVSMRMRTDGLSYAKWLSSSWYSELSGTVERFVQNSGDEFAATILSDIKSCRSSQDKFDLLKLAVICCCLGSGEFLSSYNS